MARHIPKCTDGCQGPRCGGITLKGRSTCLNFADSIWRLPVPASASAKDITKAAAEAAKIFRLSESELSEETSDQNLESLENVFYVEEEAVFGMAGLLVNMAEVYLSGWEMKMCFLGMKCTCGVIS
ncbi:hypothetical protein LguiA_034584 [Lonicera macranthoides]